MTNMIKTTIAVLFLSILSSCAIQKNTAQNEYVIAKEYSEILNGEITLISIGSDHLNCNEESLIGIRLNGKINHNLLLNGVGCVIFGTKEKGIYSIKCLCNESNKNHDLTLILRQENQEDKVVAQFDLDKLLL